WGGGERKREESVRPGKKGNKADENRCDEFLEAQRPEESAVFIHPRRSGVAVASIAQKAIGDGGGIVKTFDANLEQADYVAGAGQTLRRLERDEAPVRIVVVKTGIENARHAKAPRARQDSKGSQ